MIPEIDDLARMPAIVEAALPWLRIDRRRVYASGGSMGGQETLLLVARFPQLLAGAASFDAPTNLAARFAAFPLLRFGVGLQAKMIAEIGGTPLQDPRAYDIRSPIDWARRIAFSGVPPRSGGAGTTASSSTRTLSRAPCTGTSSASTRTLPCASSSAPGRTLPRCGRPLACRTRSACSG